MHNLKIKINENNRSFNKVINKIKVSMVGLLLPAILLPILCLDCHEHQFPQRGKEGCDKISIII